MTRMLSIRQCADRLNLSTVTVRRMVGEGTLPGSKIGGVWRVEPSDLETCIATRRSVADAPVGDGPDDLPAITHNPFL